MIGERPLRHARRLNDVTHTGADIAALEHDLEAVIQYSIFVGDSTHAVILRPYILSCQAGPALKCSGRCCEINGLRGLLCARSNTCGGARWLASAEAAIFE
jgi:hypothetical protein